MSLFKEPSFGAGGLLGKGTEKPLGAGSNSSLNSPSETGSSRVQLVRQHSDSAIAGQLNRVLTDAERAVLEKASIEIVNFQEFSGKGWLGNFVLAFRRAIGNPIASVVDTVIVPPAVDILREADIQRAKLREKHAQDVVSRKKDADVATDLTVIISLDDALEAGLRFLVANRFYEAKSIISLGIRIYPQSLALHKMFAFVVLHDRTINWQGVRLKEALCQFDLIKNPDAEIWALRGDVGRALWKLDKSVRTLADHAIVSYMKSYELDSQAAVMATPGTRLNLTEYSTYGLKRAAVLCVALHSLEMRSHHRGTHLAFSTADKRKENSRNVPSLHLKVARIYKKQAHEYLSLLLKHANDFDSAKSEHKRKTPLTPHSKRNDYLSRRHICYTQLFAHIGLGEFDKAETTGEKYAELLAEDTIRITQLASSNSKGDEDEDESKAQALAIVDELAEQKLKDEFRYCVKMAVFAGVAAPKSDDKASWHPVWKMLADVFKQAPVCPRITAQVITGALRGQVGLAFSGGGMRAAFLHLGMLARLAECDMLRSIDSISAVSGGCLVAGHYYLLVKELLESKRDEEVTKDDFINLVDTLIAQFSRGTEQDLYTATLLNPIDNLRVNFGWGLSRVSLLADRVQANLFAFSNVGRGPGTHTDLDANPKLKSSLKMRDMLVTPYGWEHDFPFFPRVHNWRRSARVPALYLNCTTLNTGHLWRFTAMYMGEKADFSGGDIGTDRSTILESVRYDDASRKRLRDIAFAECVAISSLIPAFFEPYPLEGLYPGVTVRLVDGGIYDNAGLISLYHARTDYVICNEMGSAISDQRDPVEDALGVVLRVLDISSDLSWQRVLQQLKDRLQNHGVKDVAFIHLRQTDLLTHAEREALNYNRRLPALRRSTGVRRAKKKRYWAERQREVIAQHRETIKLRRAASKAQFAEKKDAEDNANEDDEKKGADNDNDSDGDDEKGGGGDAPPLPPDDDSVPPKSLRLTTAAGDKLQGFMKAAQDVADAVEWSSTEIEEWNGNVFGANTPSLHVGHLIRSELTTVRSSLDHFTELERNALMSTGYHLATEALRSCSHNYVLGGQFFRMVGVSQDVATAAEPEVQSPLDANDPDPLETETGLMLMNGSGDGMWAYHDVTARQERNWVFTPMQEIIESAADFEVPATEYTEDDKLIYHDHDKMALELRRRLDISRVTDNPALQHLFKHLLVSNSQFSFQRVFKRSSCMAAGTLGLFLAVLLVLLGWFGVLFWDAVFSDSPPSCFCFASQPLSVVVVLVVLFVLLIKPAYISRFIWAVFVLPLHAALTLYVFDVWLSKEGKQSKLIALHRAYLADKSVSGYKKKRKKSPRL